MLDADRRLRTPLDQLCRSPSELRRERTLRFENQIVRYLVTRYKLEQSMPYLIDPEDNQRHSEYRCYNLTLERFQYRFPLFPLAFTAFVLLPQQAQTLTIGRLLHDPTRSVLGSVLQGVSERERHKRYAIIFKYPRIKVAHSLTLHNWPRVNYDVEGLHGKISMSGGRKVRLESLDVLLGTVDTDPGHKQWQRTRKP